MWSRKELKDKAKAVLTEIYWSAFGVSIVLALVGGNPSFGSNGGGSNYRNSRDSIYLNINNNNFINWSLISTWIIVLILLAIAFRIFIGYSLEVGGQRFFLKSAQYKDNRKCFSFGFDGQNYMKIVETMLLRSVFIFLWTLLLIIPGIIKSYAYRMVPYILADNPNIGAIEAITLSNEMTKGYKFDIFILDLSFIGWYLLGALALGIGVLFVMPYENATNAELYLVLRKDALENNLCSYEDLLLTKPALGDNDNIY